ncbi:hypothetical protein Lal_00016990 [Lupinus albus]|nr:hypothetical protein Lal_00016990 [Lupinus albus]
MEEDGAICGSIELRQPKVREKTIVVLDRKSGDICAEKTVYESTTPYAPLWFIFYFSSVPDSVSDSDSISNSIHVSVHSVQYTDFVHSVALSDSEHSENSVYSENMAQPPTLPGPRERTLRELAAPDFTYDSLCIQYPNEDVPYVVAVAHRMLAEEITCSRLELRREEREESFSRARSLRTHLGA